MKNSRRQFVKQTAAGFAGLSIVPRHVLGKGFAAPSDRFNNIKFYEMWLKKMEDLL